MFYYLSKVFWFLTVPSNVLPTLTCTGILLLCLSRWRKTGAILSLGSLIVLFACGLSPLANIVLLPLENRFPTYVDDSRPITGVIVLGGSLMPEDSFARNQIVLNEAGERILALGDLARRYPQAKLVFSGGGGTLFRDHVSEAEAIVHFAPSLGLAPDRIVIEANSRTTEENAAFTRRLIQPKPDERWLLVTSASHMPRAIGTFRKAGFTVVAYPVDFRTSGWKDRSRPFAYNSEGLRRLDTGAKEWAGLIGYWLTGKTDALLPAPENELRT